MKSLYLVDISSFIFRAYYAIRPLSTKEGTPVNAVFGVVNMINRLIEEKKPDHLIVCKDRPDKGFRHEIFPEYKANRGAPPEDLVPQFALIQEFIDSYPIHSFDKKSYEADDIIATLVRKFETQKDLEIFIVSSDKDLMQLVSDKVFLYDTMKNKIMGIDAVNEKFGVTPDKVIDVQALCGDSTDNIPGIPGIGPKTATKLVNDYGSVEAVLDHADELKGKMKDKVKEGRDMALLSKKLVALATDVPLDLDWNDLSLPEKDQAALNEFYSKLDFQKFIVDVNAPKKTQSESKADFVLINSEDALKKLAQAIKKSKTLLCFDTETDHINSTKANLVGMSFCFEDNKAYYLPIAHKDGTNLKIDVIKEYLGPIFSDASIKKAAQNAKYDLNVLRRAGFEIAGLSEDTMIAAYLADPTGQHGLDFLSDKFLGHKPIAFKDLVGKGQTFADVPLDKATEYAAEDAWLVSRLIAPVLEGLQEGDLKTVYQDLELPLVDVLSRMELNGIQIDLKFLEGLDTEFSERIKKIDKKIYDLAGEEFNLNSPKQLSEILFEKLGLPVCH
ncbi:MAG: hypothetical protein H7A33_06830 [Deltaproteobacteria bacterium]|nr:hypothetical protein [Deltaproteobacteria bacterium]